MDGGLNSTSKDFSRRDILILSAGAVAVSTTVFCGTALAAGETEHHGLSAFDDLSYPADFKHLKYVNPAAPKGGTFSQLAGGGTATFNSFNGFILKGDPAIDMEQVFAALMWRATDEPDAVYAYAADKVTVSADRRVYKFHLRDGITFHDGSPITAEDVAFSLTTLKTKGHPAIGNLLRDMESAEADGDRVVVVRFAPNPARSAPLTAANLPILSKAYYSKQAFDETSMEPPLGSGPYKVGKFEQGRFLEFERVKDWWGAEAADHARAEQLRRAALRLFPRPRYRVRRLQREELHVPRGVHVAGLGDALRFPGDQGRPRQARNHPRRPALRHASLDDQHPARKIPGRASARSLRLCLRFRMGEQESDVRHLCADPFLLPEFRDDGEGQAIAGGAGAARAVQGQAAPGGVRRGLESAGQRRLRARTAGCCGARRNC